MQRLSDGHEVDNSVLDARQFRGVRLHILDVRSASVGVSQLLGASIYTKHLVEVRRERHRQLPCAAACVNAQSFGPCVPVPNAPKQRRWVVGAECGVAPGLALVPERVHNNGWTREHGGQKHPA